jgi:hypothetical protein
MILCREGDMIPKSGFLPEEVAIPAQNRGVGVETGATNLQ